MSITLTQDEIEHITGQRQPSAQLALLHERGFVRAYRSRTTGKIILEREHYNAVCRGDFAKTTNRATINPSFLQG